MLPPPTTPLTGRSSGARSPPYARMSTLQWLGIAAVAQLVMFGGFIAFFFSSEHQRQGEIVDMQGELHRLRAENPKRPEVHHDVLPHPFRDVRRVPPEKARRAGFGPERS